MHISELASTLLDQMILSPELKITLVLSERSRTGIPVDGQAASQTLSECLPINQTHGHWWKGHFGYYGFRQDVETTRMKLSWPELRLCRNNLTFARIVC